MNIVVTGASRGIGYELVKHFAKNEKNTIICTARDQEKLEKLKKECDHNPNHGNVIPFSCDLSSPQSIHSLTNEIKKHIHSIDILINNAGAIVNKPFLELKQEDVQKVYQVNVFSVISMIQSLFPLMNRNERSHIVNISSVGGFQGSVKFAGLSAYSSSKAAMVCLTECLAEEFKDQNIAFNCLALGATQTEMLEEAFPGYKAPVSASDMAEFIANFSITGHKYLNGKIIPVSLSTP
ncbi:MAG: SDR family oxidoreductase [Bacteroidetes bacterium]|nr:SDR family oxidoreductase [Bacteroidota bacterium]